MPEQVPTFAPDRLRRARQARGLSLDALGALVGVGRPHLIEYEKGRQKPSPARLSDLARALGVEPLDLTTAAAAAESDLTLADLRVRAGYSGPAAAEALGISRSYFTLIAAGRRPLRPDLAERMADLFQVTTDKLLDALARGIQQGS